MKENHLEEDLKTLPFDPSNIPLSEYTFAAEDISKDVSNFVKKYEWLQSLGPSPKWKVVARVRGIIAGVVLLNEPAAYTKLLGEDTRKYECLIQRGCSVSWGHEHLGSKLLAFAINWMVKNTDKRLFEGYADPLAGEYGTIYQAIGAEYIGNKFGGEWKYKHPTFKNGKEFCAHSLRRTTLFKKYCKENGITWLPEFSKPNGFKDLSKIPVWLKEAWYQWGDKIIKESEKISIPQKGKYVIVRGRTHKEQKYLNSLKTYKTYPYPKRIVL